MEKVLMSLKHANNEIIPAGEYLGGNGIKNMHARADDMNAKLCINSKINEGTTVQLILPLINSMPEKLPNLVIDIPANEQNFAINNRR